MRNETWDRIDQLFREFPTVRAGGVSEEEVQAAENQLGLSFHADYREFLTKHGGGDVGAYPIFGLRKAESQGRGFWSVVEVTETFRRDGGARDWYLISMDNLGFRIGLVPDGRVWVHLPGDPHCIAESFEDYILRDCFRFEE